MYFGELVDVRIWQYSVGPTPPRMLSLGAPFATVGPPASHHLSGVRHRTRPHFLLLFVEYSRRVFAIVMQGLQMLYSVFQM